MRKLSASAALLLGMLGAASACSDTGTYPAENSETYSDNVANDNGMTNIEEVSVEPPANLTKSNEERRRGVSLQDIGE